MFLNLIVLMKAIHSLDSTLPLLLKFARRTDRTHTKFLLDLGCDVDALDSRGRTPLICSIDRFEIPEFSRINRQTDVGIGTFELLIYENSSLVLKKFCCFYSS